mmetsp:Transcript_108522/g.263825  ORF Transcript_108522/g.263825 Transcript_108522/m.263825 type:complete len:244 (-) Transcript_108522:18-749(-)
MQLARQQGRETLHVLLASWKALHWAKKKGSRSSKLGISCGSSLTSPLMLPLLLLEAGAFSLAVDPLRCVPSSCFAFLPLCFSSSAGSPGSSSCCSRSSALTSALASGSGLGLAVTAFRRSLKRRDGAEALPARCFSSIFTVEMVFTRAVDLPLFLKRRLPDLLEPLAGVALVFLPSRLLVLSASAFTPSSSAGASAACSSAPSASSSRLTAGKGLSGSPVIVALSGSPGAWVVHNFHGGSALK